MTAAETPNAPATTDFDAATMQPDPVTLFQAQMEHLMAPLSDAEAAGAVETQPGLALAEASAEREAGAGFDADSLGDGSEESAATVDEVDGVPLNADADVDPPGMGPADDELQAGEADASYEETADDDASDFEDEDDDDFEDDDSDEDALEPEPDAEVDGTGGVDDDDGVTDPDALDELDDATEEEALEALARGLMAGQPHLTPEEAVAAAMAARGVTDAEARPGPSPDETPTAEALEAERRELDRQWRKGVRDLLDDAVLDQMEKRLQEITELLPKARAEDAQKGKARASEFEKCTTETLELYPEANQPGTPLFERMTRIHAELMAAGDPLVHHAHKPLIIAQMAARELGMKPAKAARPGPQGPPPGMTAAFTHGMRRSGAQPALARELDGLRSPQDFEKLLRGLTGRVYTGR